MKTTNVRHLQHHFREILDWISEGQEVEITKNRKIVALLSPPRPKTRRIKWPDISKRLSRLFPEGGIKSQSLADYLSEERDRF